MRKAKVSCSFCEETYATCKSPRHVQGHTLRKPIEQQQQREGRNESEMRVVPYASVSNVACTPPPPPSPPPPSLTPYYYQRQRSSPREVFMSPPATSASSCARLSNTRPVEYSECVSKLGTIYEKLETENAALKNKVSLLEQQRVKEKGEHDKEIKAERARVSEKDEVIKGHKTELANLKAEIVEMEAAREQQNNEIAQKCGELEATRSRCQEKEEELEKVKNDAAEAERKHHSEMETVQKKLEAAEESIAELQGDRNDSKKFSKYLIDDLEKKEKELRETNGRMQSEIDQISTERDSLQSKCREQGEELTRLNGKMAELIMKNNTLKGQVGDLTTELEQGIQQMKQILEEEKAYRSNSTIHKLLLQAEMSTNATSTVTADQQRGSKRTRSSSAPNGGAPGQLAEGFVATTTDTTNDSNGSKRKRNGKGKCN